ncbi:hypothetical protein [Actinophytocola xanthii]|uniref:Uncharacterized protein n=1 Tax=Actinophytocola xanthii TaxID=1912961 RepID=A0A1Q8CMT9_9PSEU|nr:hypothetical protein [Actinophytocola xanthii]OLF15661.1 hypothetical protein BU204_20700 [Actinophytocola xanthii]
MAEDRIDELQSSLRALRRQLDQLDRRQQASASGLRQAVLAATVAGAMLVLTATTWRTAPGDGASVGDLGSLWGMTSDGWQPVAALVLVVATALGSLAVFLGEAGRVGHVVLVVLALLTALAILLVGGVEPDGWYESEDYESAAGRWLTLLAALGLAALHGGRASELRR